MRRIYESSAVKRDDDDPFTPGARRSSDKPQSMRSLPSRTLSNLVVPHSLRHRAISVRIETPTTTYPAKVRIPFTVTMRNAMPFPLSLRTDSPVVWTWYVDGHEEATQIPLREFDEDDTGVIQFDRGERKVITRHWDQCFRVAETTWERAPPGEHTIGAGINLEGAEKHGLYDETTVEIRPE